MVILIGFNRENMGKYGKIWEKIMENMGKYGKVMIIPLELGVPYLLHFFSDKLIC